MNTPLSRRAFTRLAAAPIALALTGAEAAAASPAPTEPVPVAPAMRRAAVHFDQVVSHRGGYVWSYLPDLSACWGELEARRSMCWIQPPGTPSVGHSLLDAYHATGAEECYR
ncbi:hypothetical protein, partial [Crossiella equi]